MKKILLILLCLLAFSAVTNAAAQSPEDERWPLVYKCDAFDVFLDNQSIVLFYMDGVPTVNCWVRYDGKKYITFEHLIFKSSDFSYITKELCMYKKNKKLDNKQDLTNEGWQVTTPGTNREAIIQSIGKWVIDNNEKHPPRILN